MQVEMYQGFFLPAGTILASAGLDITAIELLP